jgi:CHAT domain-containing protein
MTAFYRSLQRSGDPATALREAQLAVKEKQPHPYFWAGFVLTSRSVD